MPPVDYPDQDYYPSAKVRLIVRFEEFGTKALAGKAPAKTTPKLSGVKDDRADLKVIPDPDAPEGVTRFLLTSGGPSTPGAGTEQQKSADGLTHEITGVIPSKASWKQNGLRTADTLSLTIRWQDMPIDPRVIRSCAVEFFLGTVTPQDYAAGIEGVTRGDRYGAGVGGANEPLNLVPDTYTDNQGRARTNKRFQGWVDKWKMTTNEGEAGALELECVDNTRLLEKQQRPAKLVLGMEKPIDEAVAEYLSHFPQMEGLTVEYLPRGTARGDIPKLKGVLAGSSFVPNLGPPAGGGGSTGGAEETVLDYLTTVVGSIAHSMRVDGTRLIIQRASNLLGTGPIPRTDDPYQGRNLPSGRFPVRAFILGRNITEMTVERDFARKEPKNVEARSYDPHRKNVLVARFPEKADQQLINSGPGDGKADKNWIVWKVSNGVRDKATLKAIAEEVYNGQFRQELLVHVKTKNLGAFGGSNQDPDILDMTLGDAFEVLVNRGEDEGTASAVENQLSAAELNVQMMTALGFSDDFARAYAEAYTNAGFQREYKMKEMSVDWSIDEGVAFEVTGANYIVARVDRPTSAGTEQS